MTQTPIPTMASGAGSDGPVPSPVAACDVSYRWPGAFVLVGLAAGSDVHAVRVPRPAADVYAGPAAGGGESSPPEQTTPVRLPLDAIGRIRPRRRIWLWSWR